MHDWLHRMCPESKEILIVKRMAELEKSVMNELDRKWLKEKCEEIRKSEPGNEWVREFLKGERVEPQDPLQHSPKEKKTPVKNEYRKAQSGREFRGPFA